MPNPFDRAMPMNIQGVGPLYGNGQALFDAFGDAVTRRFNLDQSQSSQGGGGMFGASPKVQNALTAFASGFLSRRSPDMSQQLMGGMQQQDALRTKRQQDMSDYNRRRADDNADFQSHRQYEINNPLPQQPGEFESALIASGVQPGTPQWTQAMQSRVSNILDPVVMTPQGPMLRSQVLSGAPSGAPAPPGVTFTQLPAQGGQTQPASGGFLGGPYPDVGPYHRY